MPSAPERAGGREGAKTMQYTSTYPSPVGELFLACDGEALTGLRFVGEPLSDRRPDPAHREQEIPVLARTREWLDIYFSGREPDFTPPLRLAGTAFQNRVWALLREIPYGKTVTYGDIAAKIAAERGLAHMSAQAVGGALGRNPTSIIVPCHRVVGAGGSLTGYAGGLQRKVRLLACEGVDLERFTMPKQGGTL